MKTIGLVAWRVGISDENHLAEIREYKGIAPTAEKAGDKAMATHREYLKENPLQRHEGKYRPYISSITLIGTLSF